MGVLVFTPGNMLVGYNKVQQEKQPDPQHQSGKGVGGPAKIQAFRQQINEDHGQHDPSGESQDKTEDSLAGLPQCRDNQSPEARTNDAGQESRHCNPQNGIVHSPLPPSLFIF